VQLVTSAVRPIPLEWAELEPMTIVVSVDGLPAEHDIRRKPATYDRILKNIQGHNITVHCTVTRQMTERAGYVREFVAFWSTRQEVEKIWISLFTPQIGETSYEIIPPEARARLVAELLQIREQFPKLAMPKGLIEAYLDTPPDPKHCIFARVTRTVTADLKNEITPCQFGGNPDCSQCGCIASAGMKAISNYRLAGGLRVGWIYEQSIRFGEFVASLRNRAA
jgi:sulfatase maturation enzyme AslB (radical SAM superfamily)